MKEPFKLDTTNNHIVKKRLLFYELVDFVDNNETYPIALVAGIRRTGKTTLLRQLEEHYKESAFYLDLSSEESDLEDIQDYFLERTGTLFLLDEISYLRDYEIISQEFFNFCSRQNNKIVMTGSSPFHIVKLSRTKLGARCKLFRLPLLTFVEYLYFTDKISSYDSYNNVSDDDFRSYLLLKDTEGMPAKQLTFTFNADYLSALYEEVAMSNHNTVVRGSSAILNPDDLKNLIHIIAYKLCEAQGYDATFAPDVGRKEHVHLFGQGIRVKLSQIDFSSTFIVDSLNAVPEMTVKDIARLLVFMLWSGMAVIEFTKTSSIKDTLSYSDILDILHHAETKNDLDKVLKDNSICLVSPIYYSFIGSEILAAMKIDISCLCKGMLFGKMLEMYIRGALSMHNISSILISQKLDFADIGEVDVWNKHNRILCEVSVRNKKSDEVNVYKYFEEHDIIRVCASKDKEYFSDKYQYHQIPYAKLCCMIDTGDILKLKGTHTSKNDEITLAESNSFS